MESETQLEEERRLFYVGVTRAKERVYITHAFRRAMYGFGDVTMRSRFVEAIPSELIDESRGRSLTPPTAARPRSIGSGLGPRETERPASTATALTPLAAGDRVFHERFGDGVVVKVRDVNDDQEVTINFKRHGQKLLMASLANLQTG
jgi:DNA helicase-2/ATP-dependent DNA helicase PcrA